jgi:hypothetical protein
VWEGTELASRLVGTLESVVAIVKASLALRGVRELKLFFNFKGGGEGD